jgi:DNA polymerase III delta subunit
MIILVHGNDRQKINDRSQRHIETLRQKKPDASYVQIDAESYSEGVLEELSGSQGLFERKNIVHISYFSERK